MAVIRVTCIVLALIGFFLVGAPVQWLVARRLPAHRHRIPVFFCRTMLRLVGVGLSVEGAPAATHPTMMVANHVSWIDILALGAVTPFCFLAKREVASWPILSAFAEVQGTVFVDRRRKRSIPAANRAMAARMRDGRPVLLFPEGTTAGAREPGRFHSSHYAAARDLLRGAAASTRVDVQPVAIAYSCERAAWVGDDALLPHLWRMLRERDLQCVVSFAPAVAYLANSDRKAVARESREIICGMLRHKRADAPVSSAGGVRAFEPVATSA